MKPLEAFWSKFARRRDNLNDALILENPKLPLLEVNAAYTTAVVPHPILIAPADLEPVGFDFERELVVVAITQQTSSEIWVEQVPWSRATALAQVWCAQNDADAWTSEISSELTRVLQTERDLMAFLALEDERAVGMMIVSSDGFCGWSAGTTEALNALFSRGTTDFGGFGVSVEGSRLEKLGKVRVLERYRVWLEHPQLES